MEEEQRIQRAIARIEAAAERIEAAARRPAPSPAPPPNNAANDDDLARRHEALKREAWAALTELDGLIGTLEA